MTGTLDRIRASLVGLRMPRALEALGRAEREGRLLEKIRFYTRMSLLIVDEIGYLPITPGGANLFFQLVNARESMQNRGGGHAAAGSAAPSLAGRKPG